MNYHVLILFLMMAFSLRRRMFLRRRMAADLPLDPLPSPFSRALTELLATAGGIYLSLLLLVQFLSMEIPDRVDLWGLEIDPMALVAIIIASLQPFFTHFKFSRNR